MSASAQPVATSRTSAPAPVPEIRSSASWSRFLLGFVILYGVLYTVSGFDPSARWGLAVLATVGLAAIIVERVLHRVPPRSALRALGFGRPRLRPLLLSAAVSALVLLVYPVYALIESPLRLQPDWPWVLVGVIALHGLAEELVWRGYAFRRLRAGRSYWRAVWWSMPLIAAAHLPIVLTLGPAIGVSAMVVAAVTALPFSHLFETGHGTLWAPALLHAAIDSFKIFAIPAAGAVTLSFLLVIASILIPLLVLAVPGRVLDRETSATKEKP